MNLTSINEVRVNFGELQEQLSEIIGMVMDQIRDQATPDGDIDWLKHCTNRVEILKRDQKTLGAIEAHIVNILNDTLSYDTDEVNVADSGLRTLVIEVSQGMINQSLLTLSDAKRLGKVSAGERFVIQLPDGTSFKTELCQPGNKLRERGLIRKFYDACKIEDRGQVVLKETSPGSWLLLDERSSDGKAAIEPFRTYLNVADLKPKPAQGPKAGQET